VKTASRYPFSLFRSGCAPSPNRCAILNRRQVCRLIAFCWGRYVLPIMQIEQSGRVSNRDKYPLRRPAECGQTQPLRVPEDPGLPGLWLLVLCASESRLGAAGERSDDDTTSKWPRVLTSHSMSPGRSERKEICSDLLTNCFPAMTASTAAISSWAAIALTT